MGQKTTLSEHSLTGSTNIRRELQRRLDAETRAESTRFGAPDPPADLDSREFAAWTALVDELHDRLYRDDARRLAELARVEVLLALALRGARRGQTFRGKSNPAHANVEKYIRTRGKLLKVFTSRVSRPPEELDGVSAIEQLLTQSEQPN